MICSTKAVFDSVLDGQTSRSVGETMGFHPNGPYALRPISLSDGQTFHFRTLSNKSSRDLQTYWPVSFCPTGRL